MYLPAEYYNYFWYHLNFNFFDYIPIIKKIIITKNVTLLKSIQATNIHILLLLPFPAYGNGFGVYVICWSF